jgi:NDP-sugar pyrophosphorylase family protein
MKAILLVGGLGTRLRPLTYSVAKPMVPLVNRPFIEYTVELLRQHGLREIIFSSFYLPEEMQAYFGDGSKFGVSIDYCLEDTPLGTAGAIKNCERFLDGQTFLIFNGDVLTDLDLTELINLHRRQGAMATIALGKVIDPTAFGMIDLKPGGAVERWYEKPVWEDVTSRWVNLGASVFEPEMLSYIPPNQPVSIERETYPMLIEKTPVFGYQAPAYWLDIGTPSKYLRGTRNILTGVINTRIPGEQRGNLWLGDGARLDPGAVLRGPVVVGSGTRIGAGSVIIGPTVIGDNVDIGRDAFIEESVIWNGAVLEDEASLTGTIVGYEATLKAGATLKEGCIIENKYTVVASQVYADGSVLAFPH